MNTLALIVSMCSAAVALASIVFSIYTYRRDVEHNRKRDTLDAYNRLQNEVFDKLNSYLPSDIVEICKHPKSEEYNIIGAMVARIEHFCVGVKNDIYDKKTVYELAHGYFDASKLRSRIDPIIDRRNRNPNEDYYCNIHWMLTWMDDENQKR